MGQDIHAYVEYQQKHGNWEQFAHVRLARWYDLFAFMGTGGSSRRPNITPTFALRDVPEGMDIFTASAYETDVRETGIHHASWLTTHEAKTVLGSYLMWFEAQQPGKALPEVEDYTAMLTAMRALEDMGHPARLIYWFDN